MSITALLLLFPSLGNLYLVWSCHVFFHQKLFPIFWRITMTWWEFLGILLPNPEGLMFPRSVSYHRGSVLVLWRSEFKADVSLCFICVCLWIRDKWRTSIKDMLYLESNGKSKSGTTCKKFCQQWIAASLQVRTVLPLHSSASTSVAVFSSSSGIQTSRNCTTHIRILSSFSLHMFLKLIAA